MSTPQDDEQSTIKQSFKRICKCILRRKRRTSSTSRYPDAPDARLTTTATDVPSTVSRLKRSKTLPPLPVSPSQETFSNVGPPVMANYTAAEHTAVSNMGPSRITKSSAPTNDVAGTSIKGRSPVTASQTTPLPSRVEETLADCPRFRIVLVGNTGVGKSSLVSSVFNIVFNVNLPGWTPDIAHNRVGAADISHEYYSDQNPRFILHDSMGFEPGSTEKSEIVKSFLRDRSFERNAELPDQVHAIWLCIETPRTGSRLLQTGDEELLKLAKELKIPVIVVFTKYDLLVMQHYRDCVDISEATKRAKHALSEVTKELNVDNVPFSPVCTRPGTHEEYGGLLLELTQVTRANLRDVEGSLWALWASAQQINARQKVELSISEGLKKYWQNLGGSVFFEGHRLVDCIARIHDDILKIWNFNDPIKVLYGEKFLKGMIGLVEPLSDDVIQISRVASRANDIADLASNIISITSAVGQSMVLPALGSIIGMAAFQFLRSKYQKGVSTATYLAAYIVDLTLVLYDISEVVTVDPPKSLSTDLVMDVLGIYQSRSSGIHAKVKEVAFTLKLEQKIASVIWDALGGGSIIP